MVIGFTGTRYGMSNKQKEKVLWELKACGSILTDCIHGSCVGADVNFHNIVRENFPNVKITIRPGVSKKTGTNDGTRAFLEADVELPVDSFYSRNRAIVDSCEFLLATPFDDSRLGGTWQTILYAKKTNKFGGIIYPDGNRTLISKL